MIIEPGVKKKIILIIEPGVELYVGSFWSIDNGDTDMCGGIAVVKQLKKCGKTTFVEFENLKKSCSKFGISS